jgi:bacterioferritin-associated ferredoxin
MIVCQCKGVSDAAVRRAVREGASTVEEVGWACKAGTDCGGCHPTIVQIICAERLTAVKPDLVPVPAMVPAMVPAGSRRFGVLR